MHRYPKLRKDRTIKALALVVMASVLVACSQKPQPLNEVVFGENPLQQMQQQSETFKQIPQAELQFLLAYVALNQKAQMEGGQYSPLNGKPLLVVLQEAATWKVGIEAFLKQSQEIAQAMAKQFIVVPVTKDMEEADSPVGRARILKISYQVSNRTDRTIIGLQGNIKYLWPDGRQVALINVVFDQQIEPGASATVFGHSPILVGSKTSKDMIAFAEAPINQLRWEFIPSAVRYDNNDIVRVPTL